MSKLKIYTFPDPVLSQIAAPIAKIDRRYFKIADDMLETMYFAPGVGLAANQVGLLERIIVIDTDYEIEEEDLQSDLPEELQEGLESLSKEAGEKNEDQLLGDLQEGPHFRAKNPRILINPQILSHEGISSYKEGCLSVPEFQAKVQRFDKIKVSYQTIDGITQTLSADGLLSICIQHELDHLNGKLFIDHLDKISQAAIKRKLIQTRTKQKKKEGR